MPTFDRLGSWTEKLQGAKMRLVMKPRKLLIGPAHLVFVGAVLGFGLLLLWSGWTWPLDGVAVMLPLAAYLVFS
jgi:hypothetical protein